MLIRRSHVIYTKLKLHDLFRELILKGKPLVWNLRKDGCLQGKIRCEHRLTKRDGATILVVTKNSAENMNRFPKAECELALTV